MVFDNTPSTIKSAGSTQDNSPETLKLDNVKNKIDESTRAHKRKNPYFKLMDMATFEN